MFPVVSIEWQLKLELGIGFNYFEKLTGRSFDEIRQELEHSGDSIEIEVERCEGDGSGSTDDHEPKDPPMSTSRRPSIKFNGSPLLAGSGVASAASSGGGFIDSSASGTGRPGSPTDEPSPTRRRQLPQAPVVSIQPTNEDSLHTSGKRFASISLLS